MTNTQQSSHDINHPKLTNCSNAVELKFSADLPNNTELSLLEKKPAQLWGFCAPGFKESHINHLMDEDDINAFIKKCRELK